MDLLSDEEGGNLHVLNGNVVKLADAGSAYAKSGEQNEPDKPPEDETKNMKSGRRRK